MDQNQVEKQPQISANDRLGFTLFLALMLHAIVVLGVGFTYREQPNASAAPSLDIILANSQSLETPENPDFLAQADQAGGGQSDEKARPSAPVSANMPLNQRGLTDQARTASHNQQLRINTLYFITQAASPETIRQQAQQHQPETQPSPESEVEQRQSQIARLQAEIRQMTIDYAKRPRVVTLTASSKKAVEAGYLAAWAEKIEKTGNLNYPVKARTQNMSGQLRMRVRLNATGKLLDYEITQSSGSSLLDEAAKRILRIAEPFALFPPAMKEHADQVVIIRTWNFNSNTFSTNGGSTQYAK